MAEKTVAVVGAGPGGLAAAALLQKRGFQVDLFEQQQRVGGRNGALQAAGFTFDLGPTFFMMPYILEEIFRDLDRKLADYLTLRLIDPMYQLVFGDGTRLAPSTDHARTQAEYGRLSARDAAAYGPFFRAQERKFATIFPCLMRPYQSLASYLKPYTMRAARYLRPGVSVYDEVAQSFEHEAVRLSLSFQSKYLGMSPFNCPSIFTILNFIEHRYGVWHPIGGCHQISLALARIFTELGGRLQLGTPVERLHVAGNRITGLTVQGEKRSYDAVVLNADFPEAMRRLLPNESRRRYTDERLARKKYSCSTFMLYLGIKGPIKLPHHSFYFARDIRRNLQNIMAGTQPPEDASVYIHNPSVTDASLAPAGHSALYLLVPVPNLQTAAAWARWREPYREHVLKLVYERTGLELSKRIVFSEVLTPNDWQDQFGVYEGATFGLAHSLDQMLYFRPHNRLEEFCNLYLVGGATHPGSGLPTILQSARIAADLIYGSRERIRDLLRPQLRTAEQYSEFLPERLLA